MMEDPDRDLWRTTTYDPPGDGQLHGLSARGWSGPIEVHRYICPEGNAAVQINNRPELLIFTVCPFPSMAGKAVDEK